MTKYYQDRHKFDSNNNDLPISIRNYDNISSDKVYSCTCGRDMIRIWDTSHQTPSYFCRVCNVESNPETTEMRSKSKLEVPSGVNTTPYASTNFKEPSIGRKPVEPKGSFAALQSKGLRIKNYKSSFKDES